MSSPDSDIHGPTAAFIRDECLRCRQPRVSLGRLDFRTGGQSGFATALLQGFVEHSESKLPLEVFVCPRCREATFRVPDPDAP